MSIDIQIHNLGQMRRGTIPTERQYFEFLERLLEQREKRIRELETQISDHETRITALEP